MIEIRLYKLANGEEIVGRFVSEDDESVVLTNIRAMAMQPVGPGQMQVAMIPWTVGTPDGTLKIYRKNIMGEPVDTLPKQLEDGYLQNTTGVIQESGGLDLGTK